MTVEELLNHFSHYFNRIRCSTPRNIAKPLPFKFVKPLPFKVDTIEDFNDPNEIELQYENFIDEYGSLIVDDWEFDNEENSIWILISEGRQ